MGRWLWAGILPAQLLCEPRPVLSLSKWEIYVGPGKSQQRARSSERKGLRNRCKPDPGLLLQLCAAGRDLLLPFARAAAGASAEGGTQNTLALLSCSYISFGSQLHMTAWNCFSGVTSMQVFSILKGSQQLGRMRSSDILPLTVCNNTKQFAHFVTLNLVPQGVR